MIPSFTGIVAMDQSRAIGLDGSIPWHLPEDLRLFKRLTMGHPILMGRKTHDSLGRTLPGRQNIILTRDPDYRAADGALVIHSLADLQRLPLIHPEIMVIGGAQIYTLLLPLLSKLHVSLVHGTHRADTFFPPFESLFSSASSPEEYEGFSCRTYYRTESAPEL